MQNDELRTVNIMDYECLNAELWYPPSSFFIHHSPFIIHNYSQFIIHRSPFLPASPSRVPVGNRQNGLYGSARAAGSDFEPSAELPHALAHSRHSNAKTGDGAGRI